MSTSALDQLVRDLTAELSRDARGAQVAGLVSRYARTHNDWREFALFDKRTYTRNLLHKDELFELILLCWEVGQVTPIHDHRGQRCWMGVLDGAVEETLFDVPAPGAGSVSKRNAKRHERGAVAFITDDIGLHSISQVGSEPSVSLHLYSRPIPTCRVFDSATGAIGERRLTYHSVRGVRVDC